MGLRDSARWEIAAISTGLAIIFLNPYSFRVGRMLFGITANTEWYADEHNVPKPAGFILHVIVLYFVFYLLLRIDWRTVPSRVG